MALQLKLSRCMSMRHGRRTYYGFAESLCMHETCVIKQGVLWSLDRNGQTLYIVNYIYITNKLYKNFSSINIERQQWLAKAAGGSGWECPSLKSVWRKLVNPVMVYLPLHAYSAWQQQKAPTSAARRPSIGRCVSCTQPRFASLTRAKP